METSTHISEFDLPRHDDREETRLLLRHLSLQTCTFKVLVSFLLKKSLLFSKGRHLFSLLLGGIELKKKKKRGSGTRSAHTASFSVSTPDARDEKGRAHERNTCTCHSTHAKNEQARYKAARALCVLLSVVARQVQKPLRDLKVAVACLLLPKNARSFAGAGYVKGYGPFLQLLVLYIS